jgi:hypothetical protein
MAPVSPYSRGHSNLVAAADILVRTDTCFLAKKQKGVQLVIKYQVKHNGTKLTAAAQCATRPAHNPRRLSPRGAQQSAQTLKQGCRKIITVHDGRGRRGVTREELGGLREYVIRVSSACQQGQQLKGVYKAYPVALHKLLRHIHEANDGLCMGLSLLPASVISPAAQPTRNRLPAPTWSNTSSWAWHTYTVGCLRSSVFSDCLLNHRSVGPRSVALDKASVWPYGYAYPCSLRLQLTRSS